jgi:HSP20 family protein
MYTAPAHLMNWFWNDLDPESRERSVPPANIVETKDNYRIELQAPGFSKTDFSIKLDNQILTISAGGDETAEETEFTYVRHEFSRKAIARSFRLSHKVDSSNIAAKFENGILLVTIPKAEEEKSKPAQEISIA